MKRTLLIAIGALIALQPVSASAQIFNGTPFDVEYLRFIGGSGQGGAYGVQVGPYSGKFLGNGTSTVVNAGVQDQVLRSTTTLPFALYCVDFQHHASDSNGLVTLTSISGTSDWGAANTRIPDGDAYQRAAYLSSLFDSWEDYAFLGNKANVWGGLHAAIWDATTGPGYAPSGAAGAAMTYFNTLADNNAAGYNTSGWYVVSEAVNLAGDRSGQEFLMRVSVPEPSTILLMLTGIFLLFVANRRRLVEIEA